LNDSKIELKFATAPKYKKNNLSSISLVPLFTTSCNKSNVKVVKQQKTKQLGKTYQTFPPTND
jgi:hypothetical protein